MWTSSNTSSNSRTSTRSTIIEIYSRHFLLFSLLILLMYVNGGSSGMPQKSQSLVVVSHHNHNSSVANQLLESERRLEAHQRIESPIFDSFDKMSNSSTNSTEIISNTNTSTSSSSASASGIFGIGNGIDNEEHVVDNFKPRRRHQDIKKTRGLDYDDDDHDDDHHHHHTYQILSHHYPHPRPILIEHAPTLPLPAPPPPPPAGAITHGAIQEHHHLGSTLPKFQFIHIKNPVPIRSHKFSPKPYHHEHIVEFEQVHDHHDHHLHHPYFSLYTILEFIVNLLKNLYCALNRTDLHCLSYYGQHEDLFGSDPFFGKKVR